MSFRNNKNRKVPQSRSRLGMTAWHHGKKRIPKGVNKPNRSKLRAAGRFVMHGYEPEMKSDDEEYGVVDEESRDMPDGRTFTGHRESISDAENYIEHPMMTTTVASEMNKVPNMMRKDQQGYGVTLKQPQPQRTRMAAIKARPMQRHRTFNNNNNNNNRIPQSVPLSMYGMTLEHYDDGGDRGNMDYFQDRQPQLPPQPTAFPSLATYGKNVDHAGVGLYITNSYLDHFSCTTLSYLIVGCILCIIIALVIAILVVAFTG